MKKVCISIFAILFVLLLTSCTPSTATSSTATSSTATSSTATPIEYEKYGTYRIWVDPETGVNYIVYRDKTGYAGHGGITPRLNADGTLYIESIND